MNREAFLMKKSEMESYLLEVIAGYPRKEIDFESIKGGTLLLKYLKTDLKPSPEDTKTISIALKQLWEAINAKSTYQDIDDRTKQSVGPNDLQILRDFLKAIK